MYFSQCTCSPAMLMPTFRINVLEDVQVAWKRLVLHLLRFLPVIIHPVYMVSSCSSSDSGPSRDILNLADVADVLVANSIPQSVASDAS